MIEQLGPQLYDIEQEKPMNQLVFNGVDQSEGHPIFECVFNVIADKINF